MDQTYEIYNALTLLKVPRVAVAPSFAGTFLLVGVHRVVTVVSAVSSLDHSDGENISNGILFGLHLLCIEGNALRASTVCFY